MSISDPLILVCKFCGDVCVLEVVTVLDYGCHTVHIHSLITATLFTTSYQ